MGWHNSPNGWSLADLDREVAALNARHRVLGNEPHHLHREGRYAPAVWSCAARCETICRTGFRCWTRGLWEGGAWSAQAAVYVQEQLNTVRAYACSWRLPSLHERLSPYQKHLDPGSTCRASDVGGWPGQPMCCSERAGCGFRMLGGYAHASRSATVTGTGREAAVSGVITNSPHADYAMIFANHG